MKGLQNQYLDLARNYLDEGEEIKARQIVLTHRKFGPESPEIHVQWAILCEELGMAKQAQECYERALKLDPTNQECLYRFACLHRNVGRYEKSIRFLRKLLRQNPAHIEARNLLRENYEAIGLEGQAKAVSPEKERSESVTVERYFPPPVGKEDIETFLDLFSGREIGFALQELDPNTGTPKYEFRAAPLDAETVTKHLLGKITLAGYPLRSDNTVRYAALSVRIPLRVKETYAKQQSYLVFLGENMRSYVLKLAQFARTVDIPSYPEERGSEGFRLWFFFQDFDHFLRVKEFLKEFIEHAPDPESHFVLEPILPTRPVGIGWVEQCINLPLGIDRCSHRRCFFLRDDGSPYENQFIFLKKIRRIPLRVATKRLRSLRGPERKYLNNTLSFPDPVERLMSRCSAIAYLIQKAVSGQMLRREEKVILFYSVGLLDDDGNVIHRVLEPTPDYNYTKTKRQLERLQRNPISCLKIRSMIPEITASVDCLCQFDLRGGKYPSPLLHVRPHMVPASQEFLVSEGIPLKEAAERYIHLSRHVEEEKRILERLEKVLEKHFSRKGISEYATREIKVVRRSLNGQSRWVLEYV
nr:tetratricopeptide repeat protein [Desulfobacterales bacterium]